MRATFTGTWIASIWSDRYPGVQGLGYARRLKSEEIAPVEAELRRRGSEGLRIWPESSAEERTAIVLLEPLDRRNRAAIGLDMYADPVRRLAMDRARDEGTAALSGRVTLVQEIDAHRQAGFLLYVPVYAHGNVPATVEARRSALVGWAYAAFRAGDLFAALFGGEPEPLLDFQVYDGKGVDPNGLLYDRGLLPASADRLDQTESLNLGGREWTLAFTALPPLRSGSGAAVLAALLIGAAISAVIFGLSLRESRARHRAENAIDGLQRALDEQRHYEERLREEGRVNSILPRLGISLAAELDPDRLAQLVVGEATALTGADYGAIFTAGTEPRALASSGPARESFPPEAAEQLGRICENKDAVRVDATAEPAFAGAPARSVLAVPITSRTGQILGCLGFAHGTVGHFTVQHERLAAGIAAQASIALDNARLLRDLQDADRRKDEFLAVLGHELRNPLAPVVTALEVIKRDRSTIDRQLSIIERQARHMVRIVDDLLDVSRISRGKIELRKQRLSVREALARAADSLSPMARNRELKLTVSFPPRPISVEADPVRLEQILGNLLSNAIKYTPRGGDVELAARADGGQLEVRVRDTGIGIAGDALGKLFDPFVQARAAKDFAKGGLGIGLSLVRALVELHGGSVRAESPGPGKGSTFTVLLPGAIEGATPVEIVPPPPRAHHGRVLVVDDNLDAADTLAEAVRRRRPRGARRPRRVSPRCRKRAILARRWCCSTSGCPGWTGTKWSGRCASCRRRAERRSSPSPDSDSRAIGSGPLPPGSTITW